jgi:hypothetical protein
MAEAVDLAKMHGAEDVDAALEVASDVERFGDGDLASILAHRSSAEVIEFPRRHSEDATLQSSTVAWEGFGR